MGSFEANNSKMEELETRDLFFEYFLSTFYFP